MGKVIAAGVFLVNKKNEVLICHPTNHSMNLWSIPKGKVEVGETMINAAIRETYEETNINLSKADSFIMLDMVTYTHRKKAIQGFLLLETKNPSVNFDLFKLKCNSNVPKERGGFPEMDDYKWVLIDEARELLHYTQVESLDKIEEIIKRK
jgi:8-oxo-dGTP pyrophosphatase MutT (NUDIX family)